MEDAPVPTAPTIPLVREHHGHRRNDEYAWLRAENWREAMLDPGRLPPPVRRYLVSENAHVDASLASVAALRGRLLDELRGRILEDDSSVPEPDGPWAYYVRYREGGQHPMVCRRPRNAGTGGEQILLDGDAEAAGKDYFRLGDAEHSPDHRYLAYAVDVRGAEACVLRIRDLATGTDLPDRIEDAHGDFEWAADSRTLLFTVLDEEHRPKWVRRHRLGDEPRASALVYEEPDPGFFVGVDKTESARFLLITSHDHETSEIRYLDAEAPTAAPVLFAPRQRGVEYDISDHEGRWFVLTNEGGAEDFHIAECPLARTGREHWRVLIGERRGRLVAGMLVFRDWLVRQELEAAQTRLVVRHLASGEEHAIAFDEDCHSLGMSGGYEFDTDRLRIGYSSFTTPARIYDYDMAGRGRELRKAQEIPSGHDPAAYVSRRLLARAPDGELVPVSLFHRRDLSPDATTPLLLLGYGAYGMSELPAFSPHRLSMVDRGFVFAIAHVRGGREKGQCWYREGKLECKPNTFGDAIAVAEHLIAEGYTGSGRITIQGGSAGGLLVGAVVNRRPELFHGAVADVPFVDVLNTMLDPTLPLTPPEWPEWGNPIEDEAAYRTILSYSPYDNVGGRDYPHMLVTAGVSDPRVTYWEPAKWVARLRARRTNDNMLLLRTNMSAGHGGPGGRFEALEEIAERYAFLLLIYGLAG